jgi:excisionase family DNA binding protein
VIPIFAQYHWYHVGIIFGAQVNSLKNQSLTSRGLTGLTEVSLETPKAHSVPLSLERGRVAGAAHSFHDSHEEGHSGGEPTYLTAAQVAELLQVHPATIYRLTAQCPTFPALKLGSVIRFPRERLMTWLRNKEQGPRSRSTT